MSAVYAGFGYKDHGKWATKVLGKFTSKAEVLKGLKGSWLNRDVYKTSTRVYAFGSSPALVRARVNRVVKNML